MRILCFILLSFQLSAQYNIRLTERITKDNCYILATGQSNTISVNDSTGQGNLSIDSSIFTFNLIADTAWQVANLLNLPPSTNDYGAFSPTQGNPHPWQIAKQMKNSTCTVCDTVKIMMVAKSGINIGWLINGGGRDYLNDQLANIPETFTWDLISFAQGPGNLQYEDPDGVYTDSLNMYFDTLRTYSQFRNDTKIVLIDQTRGAPGSFREQIEFEKLQYARDKKYVLISQGVRRGFVDHNGDNSHFTQIDQDSVGIDVIKQFCIGDFQFIIK